MKLNAFWVVLLAIFMASCNPNTNKQATIETDENGVAF